jgi:hypothetical protein
MQTFPLADELLLIGHDEYSGKTIVSGEVLDTGLAGAVLGELLLAGRIVIADGKVGLRDPRPHGEPVTDAAALEIHKKGNMFATRSWVEYLRADVRELVARRLLAVEVIRREQGRSLLRSVVRFPANDPIRAAAPRVRLRYLLERPDIIDAQAALLAALVRICALEPVLVLNARPGSDVDLIAAATERLPPEGHALIRGVDTAIAAIALTIRR